MSRALPIALALFACACAIDTELGLDATIGSASVDVRPDPGGDVVAITLNVTYRVGEHAQESHEFMPQAVDVLVDGALVATFPPNRPAGFVPLLRPGQSVENVFTGESRPGVAMDPRRLCDAEEAHVIFRWIDDTTGEAGLTEADTSDVTCE